MNKGVYSANMPFSAPGLLLIGHIRTDWSPGGAIKPVVTSDDTTKHEHARVRGRVNIFKHTSTLVETTMIVFNYRNSIRLL